jgi:hypothetical protein
LAPVLKVPLVHAAQVRSAVRVPSVATAYPGTQAVHGMHGVAALPSWSHVPFEHACLADVLPAQYVPASQSAQTGGVVDVSETVCSVPAAQAPTGTQLAWFGDDE